MIIKSEGQCLDLAPHLALTTQRVSVHHTCMQLYTEKGTQRGRPAELPRPLGVPVSSWLVGVAEDPALCPLSYLHRKQAGPAGLALPSMAKGEKIQVGDRAVSEA